MVKAEGRAADAHRAFDVAVDKLEKQVRRYNRRLKNYHERATMPDSP
jgi:ribosome-associated translation inhibitor RaiA